MPETREELRLRALHRDRHWRDERTGNRDCVVSLWPDHWLVWMSSHCLLYIYCVIRMVTL